MKRLRVLLVDDHPVVREGIRALLASDVRFEVVGEASEIESAVTIALTLQPDVVIMDVALPGPNGVQATRRLKAQQPAVRVLGLTIHEEGAYLRSLLDAGASGYVLKRSAASELIHALHVVSDGGRYLDPSMAGHLAGRLVRGSRQKSTLTLSERESEVVRLVARGYSNKEIAAKLEVSVKTVETYRYRAIDKLGLRGRADLVRYSIEQGWLEQA